MAALALHALKALSPKDRRRVLCWFCWCGEHVGPGESKCANGHPLGEPEGGGTCATCKHWDQSGDEARKCLRVIQINENDAAEEAYTLAEYADAPCWLFTRGDFGCVLHEERRESEAVPMTFTMSGASAPLGVDPTAKVSCPRRGDGCLARVVWVSDGVARVECGECGIGKGAASR